MTIYGNLNGNSGVYAYAIGEDRILVQFRNGRQYLYTDNATGQANIEQMKLLATQGRGLATFISRCVKKKYAKRVR